MGRKRHRAELFVFMNGMRVGQLTRAFNGMLGFSYDAKWLANESRRPLSLSMPLSAQAYTGGMVENFFDNLLPDGQPIRNRIQRRFGADTNRCFDLLWHVGRDCVGALQILPEDTCPEVKTVEAVPLTEAEIADTLKNYQTMPLGMREDSEFRISIAGAQEKTAFLKRGEQWCRPVGTTPTTHIFKLPIGRIEHSGMDLSDSVENEWLCHAILKAFGIPVANTEIMSFDGVKVLVVERFDRRWADDKSWLVRLPQEDMCQALNVSPALKYESDGGPGIERIMQLLLGSDSALEDRKTFMNQVLLFWMLGAIDGHAKNFSIFLLPGGAFKLTPAYDIMSAYTLVAKGQLDQQRMTMAMSLRGTNRHYKWEHLFYRHWLATSKSCNFPEREMKNIVDMTVARLEEVVSVVQDRLPSGFPERVAVPVFDGLRLAKDRIRQG
jgi:serine/threonine-protein kinase HipA